MASGQREIGEVILKLDNISLSFGGVKALTDISFDVRAHEIRAIIGPNGAGKSSMLNVINGVYRPQQGTITFHGKARHDMDTHDAAAHGIARTFQNIALFKGMSVLDNIMTGRNLKIRASFIEQALWWGRARREEIENRRKVRRSSIFSRSSISAGRRSGGCPMACRSASSLPVRSRRSHRYCCSTSRWPA